MVLLEEVLARGFGPEIIHYHEHSPQKALQLFGIWGSSTTKSWGRKKEVLQFPSTKEVHETNREKGTCSDIFILESLRLVPMALLYCYETPVSFK